MGDGSTFKGNDIERFDRYGLLANPALRIYKPWLDADFVDRAGRPGRDERVAPSSRTCPTGTAPRRPTPTDANIWGATHEAKTLEHLDVSLETRRADHGREVLGPVGGDRARGRHHRLREGPAGRHQRHDCSDDPVALVHEANTIGGRHGLGMSDQIENRIIEAKSRGIYEAPGMAAAVHRLRAAAQRHPQRGHAGQLPRAGPAAGPAALRGSVVRPAGADAAGVAAAVESRSVVDRRGHAAAAAGRGLLDRAHRRPGVLLPARPAVDGAHRVGGVRPGRPHRPAHHAQPRHRRLPTTSSSGRADPPGARRWAPGAVEPGGRRPIEENPVAEPDEEASAPPHGIRDDDRSARRRPPWGSASRLREGRGGFGRARLRSPPGLHGGAASRGPSSPACRRWPRAGRSGTAGSSRGGRPPRSCWRSPSRLSFDRRLAPDDIAGSRPTCGA